MGPLSDGTSSGSSGSIRMGGICGAAKNSEKKSRTVRPIDCAIVSLALWKGTWGLTVVSAAVLASGAGVKAGGSSVGFVVVGSGRLVCRRNAASPWM